MIAQTPLEQALIAFGRVRTDDRQPQVDDAVALGETGMFSNQHIALITGLHPKFVGELTGKKDKTGGRFNPEALDDMYQLRLQWARARVVSRDDVRKIVNMGVSPNMLSKLTGIARTSIYTWTKGAS